jgi:predicted nucleic acid-binding protein
MDEEVEILCDTDVIIEFYKNNLKIPDALIASSAIANKVKLFTLNKKDFKFIQELNLYQFA